MKIFNYDEDGRFTFESEADPDPLQPGEWIIPARSTIKPLPKLGEGEYAVFDQQIDDRSIKQSPKPNIELVKKERWNAIAAERDRLIQTGGYQVDGFWFHSDAYSLTQQQGLILSAMQIKASGGDMDAPLMETPWYAMGGVPVVMTANLALRLLPAAMAQQVAIFEAAKAHKVAMEASGDPDSYDYTNYWPKVFGSQQ